MMECLLYYVVLVKLGPVQLALGNGFYRFGKAPIHGLGQDSRTSCFEFTVHFDFTGILAKAHQPSSRVLNHHHAAKGKAECATQTRHVKASRFANHEAVAPTTNTNANPLGVIAETKGAQAIVNSGVGFDGRELSAKGDAAHNSVYILCSVFCFGYEELEEIVRASA